LRGEGKFGLDFENCFCEEREAIIQRLVTSPLAPLQRRGESLGLILKIVFQASPFVFDVALEIHFEAEQFEN